MYELKQALVAMQRTDPSGWEVEPTEADYENHMRWAVRNFGEQVWQTYAAGNWATVGCDVV